MLTSLSVCSHNIAGNSASAWENRAVQAVTYARDDSRVVRWHPGHT
jgi:hypothetical protein